MLYFVYDVIIK